MTARFSRSRQSHHVINGCLAICDSNGRRATGCLSFSPARVTRKHLSAAGEVLKILEEIILYCFTLEACQAILNVGGVGWLRHLAVVNHRHACIELPLHNLTNGVINRRLQRLLVNGDTVRHGEHELDQLIRSWQAAGVGTGNTMRAPGDPYSLFERFEV